MGDSGEGDCGSELVGSDGPGERKSGLAGEKVSKQAECEGCKRMRDLKEREPEEEGKATRQMDTEAGRLRFVLLQYAVAYCLKC